MTNAETPKLLSLHPKRLSDEEFSIYEAEFQKVLGDPLCKNIALSGPYGAGKSSVIEKAKYRQQNQGEKWVTISLATFGGADDGEQAGTSSSENAIETEILRQMVHKVGTSKAPKSGFRELADRRWFVDAGTAIAILTFVLLTVFLTNNSDHFFSLQPSPTEGCAFGIWMVLAGFGLYRLARSKAASRIIRRIKLFDAELEISSKDSRSPYERCADEIVYLLNASGIDAVVFEDLDRFDSIAIFERMRNLNVLANDSRLSEKKKNRSLKPLRFFYLMRDGLFRDPHDRTKFFDYVIPVVPYIDPHNALDIMKDALGGVGLTVDEGFLYQLSSYIDDPRIVHAIADEAYHYKKALFGDRAFMDGDSERLVAMLAYKALFPRDFEQLQVGRGYLHEVLNGKQRLIADSERINKDKRDELQRELDEMSCQLKASEDELVCLFGVPGIHDVYRYVDGDDLESFDPQTFLESARSGSTSSQRLESLMDTLNNNERYQARLREARGDADRRSEVIRSQLEELDAKSSSLRAKSIKQLVDELPDADALFDFDQNDISRTGDYEDLSMEAVFNNPSFPMVRFLVSSGWIDESYRRYISNFHPNSLCAEDYDYLSTISQVKPIDLTYEPKSPGEIVRRMDRGMFSRESIRNPWLVSALLDGEDEEKIDAFMASVKRSGGVRYLAQFISSGQFNPNIFAEMFKHFDDPVAELLGDRGVSDDDKRCFCKRYLVDGGGLLLSESPDGALAKFANADSRFLREDSRFDDASIGEGLRRIGYRAEAIDFAVASLTLLDFVFENRLFAPSPSVIDGFLSLKHDTNGRMDSGDMVTAVLKLPAGPIQSVVSDDLDRFISNVVEESKVPLRDAPECVIAVLNDEGVLAETGKSYITSLEGVEIEDVSQVDLPEYRDALLASQLVRSNADNVILFYRRAGNRITDELGGLIEAKGAPIGLNVDKCKEADVDEADVVGKIVGFEGISVNNKRDLLKACGFAFPSFDIDDLDDLTTRMMIGIKAIDMNAEMLDEFRRLKPHLTVDYILSGIDDFLSLVGDDASGERTRDIEENEVTGLLASDIGIDKKLAALSCFDGSLLLDESYEIEINDAIITDHFDQRDLTNLPSFYQKAFGGYRSRIAEKVAEHSETIIDEEVDLDWNLLREALGHLKANRDQALQLLGMSCRRYGAKDDRGDVLGCFKAAGLENYAKLIEGSQSMIPKSDTDDSMLSTLYGLGMCGSVARDVNEKGLRKVYPKGYKQPKKES